MSERTPVPDAQQQAAINHPLTPLRIVAGAGSGKTEVMARRVVAMVERGDVADHQVLGLTFSNKAAANLRERVVARLGPANRVHIATYHGFGAQLVSESAALLGLPPEPRLLDRARAFQLLLDELHRVDLPNKKLGRPESVVADVLTLASSCADHLVSVETLRADCESIIADSGLGKGVQRIARGRLDLCVLLDAYSAAKRRLGYIDYGDQIALAVEVLRTSPEVISALRERYKAVLLDEFQDTNVAQRELLKMVWVNGWGPGTSPLTAVGDDLQAIYGFRGAHVDNLIRFHDHVPGTVSLELETNYRSGATVVDLANHVHRSITRALPKTLRAHSENKPATVESFVASDERDEAADIAARILAIRAGGSRWNDIAVLCRKRRLIDPIANALQAVGVPVEILGIGGLLTRPEIVDTIAWLQMLALPEIGSTAAADRRVGSPDPNIAVIRLLQGPTWNIGLRDLAALSRADRERRSARDQRAVIAVDESADSSDERVVPPVDPGLDLRRVVLAGDLPNVSPEAWRRLVEFRSVVDAVRPTVERRSLVDAIEAVIAAAGLWQAVDERGHENLLRFLHLAHTFAPLDGPTTVASFLEYLDLVMLSEDEPAEATAIATDAVQIMTVHQAKGLEFDTVFVPGLAGSGSSRIFPDFRSSSNGVTVTAALPHWLRLDNDGFERVPRSRAEETRLTDHVKSEQEQEERRLLYVALTRARERLIVSAAHWYGDTTKPQGVSEFYELLAQQPGLVCEARRAEPATERPATVERRRRQEARAAEGAAAAAGPGPSDAPTPAPPPRATRSARKAGDTLSLFELRDLPPAPASSSRPSVWAATSLVTYAQCPKRFEWSHLTPLPRRTSIAARVGTAVHEWIEARALGVETDASRSVSPIVSPIESPIESPSSGIRGFRASFLASAYGSREPDRVEESFALDLNGTTLRGRIDLAFAPDPQSEGRYEVIDVKTGRQPDPDDSSAGVQLAIYALAAVDQWGVDPDQLRTSYVYVAFDGSPPTVVSTDWSTESINDTRTMLSTLVSDIAAGRFSPHGGAWCNGCDFATFCPGAVVAD